MKCSIAVAQMDPVLGDPKANVRKHIKHAEDAVRNGADLVVFPELSLTGYSVKDLAPDLAIDPDRATVLRPLRELSKRITIIAGGIVRGEDHGVYNAGLCFEGGALIHTHRKVYPPNYGMFEEGRYFSAGRTVRAFDSKHGRFALLVCEDAWHLSLPYLAMLDGAEAVFTLTASPTRVGSRDDDLDNRVVNYDHHRAYARLLSLYTVFVNRVGYEDGVNFWGGSAVFGPSGECAAQAMLFDEELMFGLLDSEEVRRARGLSRHVLDERADIMVSNLRRIINEQA